MSEYRSERAYLRANLNHCMEAPAAHLRVVWRDLKRSEARLNQKRLEVGAVREREPPGACGVADRVGREVSGCDSNWKLIQLVLFEPPPADEPKPSAGSQGSSHIPESSGGVVEEHHPEA